MAIVECTLGAETQTFDGTEYSFKRDRQGRFVALVHSHDHVKGFLASPYYRIVDDNDEAETDLVEETPKEEIFEDETDEQISARLKREQEERDAAAAIQAQADAQAAESEAITNAVANDQPIVIEEDPHTTNQMPTHDPSRDDDLDDATVTETSTVSDDDSVDEDDDEIAEIIHADDLTEISGIGDSVQDVLNEAEIFTYTDLANTSDERLKELNDTHKMRNSYQRFNWRDVAADLAQKQSESE